jgi:alginate lyase
VALGGHVGCVEEDNRVSHQQDSKPRTLSRRGFGVAIVAVAAAGVIDATLVHHDNAETVNSSGLLPSQLLDLSVWKIDLPTTKEVKNPQLETYSDAAFRVVGTAVQFTAHCGDKAQPGSKYARCELREMNKDGSNASWSTTSGTHTMTITQRITHLPVVKPELVCGQIHNASYLILVRLSGKKLTVDYIDAVAGTLDDDYQLGMPFDLTIVASGGYVDVYYNGARKVHQAVNQTGCYFKAGCYLQSSTLTGDLASAYGQVEISKLVINHAA